MRLVRSLALGIAVAALALGVAACGARSALDGGQGGASGTGSVGAGGISGAAGVAGAAGAAGVLTTLCGTFIGAICTFYMKCQGTPQFKDLDQCRSELDCYGVPALLEALNAGHVALDEKAVAKCFSDFYASPCDPVRIETGLQNDQLDIYQFLAACSGVLTPLEGVGEPCKVDAECEFRLSCAQGSCPGVCEPRFELGQPCSPELSQCSIPYGICQGGTCRIPAEKGGSCIDDLDCNRDLLCDQSTHTCVDPVRPGLGGGCIRDINGGKPALLCQPNLFCNDDNIGKPGVCAELQREGQACNYNGCERGLECVALGGGPRVCHGKAPLGGLCDYAGDFCQGELVCVPNNGPPPTGVCTESPPIGQSCSFSDTCGPNRICNGVCSTPAYSGDRCDRPTSECVNSRCVDGTCHPYVHVGEPCTYIGDCLTAACQNGVCLDRTACTPF